MIRFNTGKSEDSAQCLVNHAVMFFFKVLFCLMLYSAFLLGEHSPRHIDFLSPVWKIYVKIKIYRLFSDLKIL